MVIAVQTFRLFSVFLLSSLDYLFYGKHLEEGKSRLTFPDKIKYTVTSLLPSIEFKIVWGAEKLFNIKYWHCAWSRIGDEIQVFVLNLNRQRDIFLSIPNTFSSMDDVDFNHQNHAGRQIRFLNITSNIQNRQISKWLWMTLKLEIRNTPIMNCLHWLSWKISSLPQRYKLKTRNKRQLIEKQDLSESSLQMTFRGWITEWSWVTFQLWMHSSSI